MIIKEIIKRILSTGRSSMSYVCIVLVMLVISCFVGWLVINQNTNLVINRSDGEIRAFSDLSAKPITDTYELYHSSGFNKFKEIIREYLSVAKNISRVQLINIEGKILFDSNQLETARTTEEMVSTEIVEKGKKLEPSYILDEANPKKYKIIVYPYIEEWGKHSYAVVYYVNYTQAEKDIISFRNQIILFISLLTIAAISVLTFIMLSQKLALKKEEKSQLEELNKQKDEFIMIASHALRTPLTSINGFLSLLEEDSKNIPERNREYIKPMRENTNRLASLTEIMLDINFLIASEGNLKKESINLKDLLGEIYKGFLPTAKKKQVFLKIERPPSHFPNILADKKRLKTAISNIVENAIKFNKKDGFVEVKTTLKNNQVIISVSDSGIGLDKKEIGHLFEEFGRGTDLLTYDYEGVGLGLYLSKLIIEKHGGKISVESEKNKGSTFYISLPIITSV